MTTSSISRGSERSAGALLALPLLAAGLLLAGCAAAPELPPPTPSVTVPVAPTPPAFDDRQKQELLALARLHQERREFKKVLNTLKEIAALNPGDREVAARARKLEAGLTKAVGEHLGKGKNLLRSGDVTAARAEFLMVLFLEPEHAEALSQLRSITGVSPEETLARAKSASPALKVKGHIEHVIKGGETLSILAQRYYGDKMRYQDIADYNKIADINSVSVGQKILVPLPDSLKAAKAAAPKRQPPPPAPAKPPEKVQVPAVEAPEPAADKVEAPEPAGDEPVAEEDALAYVLESIDADAPAAEPDEAAAQGETAEEMDARREVIAEMLAAAERQYEKEDFENAASSFTFVLQKDPAHSGAQDRLDEIGRIADALQRGEALVAARRFGDAHDEFNKILEIKPESTLALEKMEGLITPMLTEASYLLNDEQSPCEAMLVIRKVLKHEPGNREAGDLIDEAETLAEGLELHCNN